MPGDPQLSGIAQALHVVIGDVGESAVVQVTTAQAADHSTAAATAVADSDLAPLLGQLEATLRADGQDAAAEAVAHLATVMEQPTPDRNKVQRLWNGIKVVATTNEAMTLLARIAPLLPLVTGGGAHH